MESIANMYKFAMLAPLLPKGEMVSLGKNQKNVSIVSAKGIIQIKQNRVLFVQCNSVLKRKARFQIFKRLLY